MIFILKKECDKFLSAKVIVYLRCCLDRFRKWELSHECGRVVSVDNGIFIHAIVPRHVETVAQLIRQ